MARQVNTILAAMQTALVSAASLVGLTIVPTNWSKTDYKSLILYIQAAAQAVQEQLYDSFTTDVENIALVLPPQSSPWFQNQMINVFEYDATAVPVVQLDETTSFVPIYPNPNPTFNIIKYCSVIPGIFGSVGIKIAGAGPSQITGTALAAAQQFINTAGSPGIRYSVTSGISDKLYMQLDVYYNALFAAVIQTNVISAINLYLQSIPFNGVVTVSKLQEAILSVDGVLDCVLINAQARANSTTVLMGTNLVINSLEVSRNWQTQAGYIIPESTTGYTLTDFRVGSSGPLNLNLISNQNP